MIVLGIALFVIGVAASIEVLQIVAVIPVAVGVVLLIQSSVGRFGGESLHDSWAPRVHTPRSSAREAGVSRPMH